MKAWRGYFSRNAETGLKRPGAELYPDDPGQKLPLLALQPIAPEVVHEVFQKRAQKGEAALQVPPTMRALGGQGEGLVGRRANAPEECLPANFNSKSIKPATIAISSSPSSNPRRFMSVPSPNGTA